MSNHSAQPLRVPEWIPRQSSSGVWLWRCCGLRSRIECSWFFPKRLIVSSYWDVSRDLINPGWVTWGRVYDVARPETPYDLRLHH